VDVFVQLLSYPDVTIALPVSDVLVQLLTRATRETPCKGRFLMLFPRLPLVGNALRASSQTLQNVMNNERLSEQNSAYRHHRRLCQVVVLLASIQLDLWNPKHLPPNYELLLDLLLEVTAHPSLNVTILALQFWKRAIAHQTYRTVRVPPPLVFLCARSY